MKSDSDQSELSEEEIESPLVFEANGETAEEWWKALEKVVPAVVLIRTTVTRFFDAKFVCGRSETVFVVDRRRGIVLTSRNVVNPDSDQSKLSEEEIDSPLVFEANGKTAEEWWKALEKVVSAVVLIRTTVTRFFLTPNSYVEGVRQCLLLIDVAELY
nr:protease Do-like 7 [Tanacetum cinerariifolium]